MDVGLLPPAPRAMRAERDGDALRLTLPSATLAFRVGSPLVFSGVLLLSGLFVAQGWEWLLVIALAAVCWVVGYRQLSRPATLLLDPRGLTIRWPDSTERRVAWADVHLVRWQDPVEPPLYDEYEHAVPSYIGLHFHRPPLGPPLPPLRVGAALDTAGRRWLHGAMLVLWADAEQQTATQ